MPSGFWVTRSPVSRASMTAPLHDEMADALKRLARLIEQIVDGEGGKNVVPMRAPAVQP